MPKGIPKNGVNKGWFRKGNVAPNKGKKMANLTGVNNHNWKGGQLSKKCLVCGKKFYRDRHRIEKAKFCSHSCKAKYNLTGNKHHLWKGGISNERDKLKDSKVYRKWRLKVFQRDRFTCKMCGHRSVKSKAHGDKTSDIHAHHIYPIKKYPQLCLKTGNGITLCVDCHRLTYSKEENFTTVFKEILNDYMPNMVKT
jgi:hypothetical protein